MRYLQEPDPDAALDMLSLVIRLKPDNPVVLGERGNLFMLDRQMDKAEADFQSALRHATDEDLHARIHLGLGKVHFLRKDWNNALAELSLALKLRPKMIDRLRLRARLYLKIGNEPQALADIELLLLLQPKDVDGLIGLAELLSCAKDEQLRDPILAVGYANAACELTDRKDPFVLALLAGTYASAGRFESTVSWQQKAIDLTTNAVDILRRGVLACRNQRLLRIWNRGADFSCELPVQY